MSDGAASVSDGAAGVSDGTATIVPEGYKEFHSPGPFASSCGPFHYRPEPDGGYSYGFAAGERHANPYGVIHGGVLFTFADTFMGRTVVAAGKCACATITLNTEFMAGGKAGTWIEGRAEVTRLTRGLAFMRGEVLSEGTLLMTASGVWRLFPDRNAIDGGPRDAGAGA